MQHLHLELTRAASQLAAPSRRVGCLGRGTEPRSEDLGRVVEYYSVYLDNWDQSRRLLRSAYEAEVGKCVVNQAAL